MKPFQKSANRLRALLWVAGLWSLAVPPAQAKEPMFNGRYLSDWLCCEPVGDSQTEAIMRIGTNAIPALLDILGAKDGTVRKVASRLDNKSIARHVREDGFAIDEFTGLALKGFKILGTNAESAVPQMAKLLNDVETVSQAADALAAVGPKGFMVLTNALISKNHEIRNCAVCVLNKTGGDPKVITQLLIRALKDPDWAVRGNAADSLSGKDLALAIPALLPLLDDKEDYPRERAIISLGSYGPAAKVAAPKLLTLSTNRFDRTIFDALKSIDMETAGIAERIIVNSGPLSGARIGYTRTLLKDGRELIAGGYIHTEIPAITNHSISSAVLMNSKTGKWVETANMRAERYDHTATLLTNGRVLVTGGSDDNDQAPSSAEIYDPANESWTPTSSMNHAHSDHYAKLLGNGHVLIYSARFRSPIYNVEEFDPANNKWTVVTNLTSVPK